MLLTAVPLNVQLMRRVVIPPRYMSAPKSHAAFDEKCTLVNSICDPVNARIAPPLMYM